MGGPSSPRSKADFFFFFKGNFLAIFITKKEEKRNKEERKERKRKGRKKGETGAG